MNLRYPSNHKNSNFNKIKLIRRSYLQLIDTLDRYRSVNNNIIVW